MDAISATVVAAQQTRAQTNATMSFIKQNAEVEQQMADMISEASGGRGQLVDVIV